jgi:hypothetical protein
MHPIIDTSTFELDPEAYELAVKCIDELLPLFGSISPNDYRRVARPTENGIYSIEIQRYRGSHSWAIFRRMVEASETARNFDIALERLHPGLMDVLILPGQAMPLGRGNDLLSVWCLALESVAGTADQEKAARALLKEFSSTIRAGALNYRITTSIAGLKLPFPDFNLRLSNVGNLRAITADEFVSTSSQDISFGDNTDIVSQSVSSCAEFNGQAQFSLNRADTDKYMATPFEKECGESVTNLLRALHALKAGSVRVFSSRSEFTPKIFPHLNIRSSNPGRTNSFVSYELLAAEIDDLTNILSEINVGLRDEVNIALDRLIDAENRTSPVDSLLDAAIGLEALLNPNSNSELAFRVALNYAYLGPKKNRRERYDRVKTIQKTRNLVVHNGLNLRSPDATKIYEHASLARACLRDAVKFFLLDKSFKTKKKLDADFWLDRILPVDCVDESDASSF